MQTASDGRLGQRKGPEVVGHRGAWIEKPLDEEFL